MLNIIDSACCELSVLFHVPKKIVIVYIWIHENVSVEK